MRIADVLRNKGAAVVTIHPDATVRELLAGLAEQNIGAMVVVGTDGVVGIVSERDVVRQLHTHGASVLSRPISTIMTATVATCTKSDTVDSVSVLMTKNRVRHVPVLDGKKLSRHRQYRRRREDANGRTRGRAAAAAVLHHARLSIRAAQRQEYSARSRAATTSKSLRSRIAPSRRMPSSGTSSTRSSRTQLSRPS